LVFIEKSASFARTSFAYVIITNAVLQLLM